MSARLAVSPLEKTLNTVSIVLSGIAIGLGLAAAGVPFALAAGLALGVAGPGLYLYKDVKVDKGDSDRAPKPSAPDHDSEGFKNAGRAFGWQGPRVAFAGAAPRQAVVQTSNVIRRTKYGASFGL